MSLSKELFEKYAVNILESFYPEIKDMIKGESPDYSNKTIGIEITRAITKQNGEIDAFLKKYNNCKFQDLPQKQLKKFGFDDVHLLNESIKSLYIQRSLKNGILYYCKQNDTGNLILCGYIGKSTTNQLAVDDISKSISEKLCKLNDHYRILERNDLCIIVQEQLNYYGCQEEIIDDLIGDIISLIKMVYEKNEYEHYFDNIYLLFIDNIFEISSKTWKYRRNIITQEQIDTFIVQ